MSGKDFLSMALLMILTMWGVEFLFSRWGKKPEPENVGPESGQSYVAPKSKQELKPQNVEVDFVDMQRPTAATKTVVETPTIHAVFTTDGASLEELSFKRGDENARRISTISAGPEIVHERRCFLVALEEPSPYYYELVAERKDTGSTTLTYKGTCPQGVIRKTFIVWHDKYQIDMEITLVPAAGKAMVARIFYPTPHMPDAVKDPKSLVVSALGGAIKKIARTSLDERMGWYEPTLFGSDDRYFVHALVTDPHHFVQRAYYKLFGQDDFLSIIEGPGVTQETTHTVSFYFGPKEISAMRVVDSRLEKTLDYSTFLAPLYRLFLAILLFLFAYLKNYGLAIIALTVLLKLILLPFSIRSERSMKKHAEMQKKLDYLQQRYKHDPETLTHEKAELIRKHGMPGFFGSCLPLLLQLPVFYIIMRLLSTSVELYQAPFLWVSDISAADPLYILPVLVALSMVAQALVGDRKQLVMMLVMALVLGALSASFSVGVCLYLVVSTFLGVAQTIIQKRFKAA